MSTAGTQGEHKEPNRLLGQGRGVIDIESNDTHVIIMNTTFVSQVQFRIGTGFAKF